MSRAQQSSIESTASTNSAADTAAADKSESTTQSDIDSQQSQLAKFAANNPYVQGGQMQTLSNQQLSDTADATATAGKAANQALAQRTGQNPQAGIAAGEAEAQEAQRTLGNQESQATQTRIGDEAGYNQTALKEGDALEGEQEGLTNTETGQAQGQLGTAEQAAQTPSFMDELGSGLIQAGAGFAGGLGNGLGQGWCPAAGTRVMMADGSERLIETLVPGDHVAGIDGKGQIVELVESQPIAVLRLELEDGRALRTSYSHAFVLPFGGFVSAIESLGRTVATDVGPRLVTAMEKSGLEIVFNIITSGSHTYCADGVWSLGMSQTERSIGIRFLQEVA